MQGPDSERAERISARHLAVARRLGLDATTVQVVGALREHGVRALLFKGPVLEHWLYPDGRRYGDIDLLVSPVSFRRAESVLAELGFQMRLSGARASELSGDERTWRRASFDVDLHRSVWGVGAPADTAWAVLSERTAVLEIRGARVDVASEAVQAFLVALHAARHGRGERKPLEDLRRALDIADESLWREAAEVARRLGSSAVFAVGLGLLPKGQELAGRLGLQRNASTEVHLCSEGAPPVAMGLLHFATAPSLRARLALLIAELVPSPSWMRITSELARRGRIGLFAAYVVRPFSLCRQTPAAWRAVREARRRASAARCHESCGVSRPARRARVRPDLPRPYRRAGSPRPESCPEVVTTEAI